MCGFISLRPRLFPYYTFSLFIFLFPIVLCLLKIYCKAVAILTGWSYALVSNITMLINIY